MGKNTATAATKPTQPTTAAVLPRPKLVGAQQQAAKPSASTEASKGPAPKHEPTLLGLPKHLPTAPPPLRQSTTPASKGESSLVGLSRKLESASPRTRTGVRMKAPSPPPASGASDRASEAPPNRRHAADPTDHNVEIIAAYATPPVPKGSLINVIEGGLSYDDDWQADVEMIDTGNRKGTIFAALALAVLCSIALAVCARSMSAQKQQVAPARHAVETRTAAASPALPTPTAAEPAAIAAPALTAAMLGAPAAPQVEASPTAAESDALLSPKAAKSAKKLPHRKHAQAHRRHAHRKVSRPASSGSLDTPQAFR